MISIFKSCLSGRLPTALYTDTLLLPCTHQNVIFDQCTRFQSEINKIPLTFYLLRVVELYVLGHRQKVNNHSEPFLQGWCHEEITETLFLRREQGFLIEYTMQSVKFEMYARAILLIVAREFVKNRRQRMYGFPNVTSLGNWAINGENRSQLNVYGEIGLLFSKKNY